jgi:saccharopepsin
MSRSALAPTSWLHPVMASISRWAHRTCEMFTHCAHFFYPLRRPIINQLIRYNFGNPFASDSKGPTPYMQFLSETDPKTAIADALASRKLTLSQLGPEVSPQAYLKVLQSQSGASSKLVDTTNHTGNAQESAVEKYAPTVIALLAANLLVGLVLLVLGVLGCVRRGVGRAPKNSIAPSNYVAVRSKEEDHVDMAPYHMPYSSQ